MKTNLILLRQAVYCLLFCLGLTSVQAQMRVGQPSGSPDPSAALDVSGGPYSSGSLYRGIVPPKAALIQTTQATPIINPATGLLIYNTAKAGDVTPGYYYWEGSRWARFSTTNAGAARIATAGGGQSIPAYLLSDLPNLTAPYPDNFILVDRGREGLFRLDATDTTTTDNKGTVLVTGGKRYKRAYTGMIEVEWFGASGFGLRIPDTGQNHTDNLAMAAANTAAIQAAVDWAAYSAGTVDDPSPLYPRNKERPSVVHVPAGTYWCDGTINLKGAITFQGDGGNSFGGTVFNCYPNAHHLFSLAGPPTTNASNAVVIRDMRMLLDNNDPTTYSCIYSDNPTGSSYHSLTVEGVWFQLAYNATAYWGKSADDVLITKCRFDGSAVACPVRLGSTTGTIANMKISNCTIYNPKPGIFQEV